MSELNLPDYTFRTKREQDKVHIFDAWRKKWVRLTPEEWVRQNFIRYMIEECGYPPSSIGVEVGISINGRKLRADGVVYDKYGEVYVLMEFKAPTVAINEQVFSQTADYNTKIGAKIILISNGISHFCAHVTPDGIKLADSIPTY